MSRKERDVVLALITSQPMIAMSVVQFLVVPGWARSGPLPGVDGNDAGRLAPRVPCCVTTRQRAGGGARVSSAWRAKAGFRLGREFRGIRIGWCGSGRLAGVLVERLLGRSHVLHGVLGGVRPGAWSVYVRLGVRRVV